MAEFIDQIGRSVHLDKPPERIISLVPSQTELLYDLGLNNKVVGITKFCIHPQHWHESKMRVGGTKTIHLDKIHSLQPDLIICNKEENTKEIVEQLEKDYCVWVSDISSLSDAYKMIHDLGQLFCISQKANELVDAIKMLFKTIEKATVKKVLYFIWRNPWMVAGKGTIIDSIINEMGWLNAICKERYPVIDLNEEIEVDEIFLSSEPYPFTQKHIEEIKTNFPSASIRLVDGEMFSWYGSRLLNTPTYLNTLINSSSN